MIDKKNGEVSIYSYDFIHTNIIGLKDKKRKEFLGLISKWQEWNKIALLEKDKLDKVLGTIRKRTMHWVLTNDGSWSSSYASVLEVNFFSQSKNRHQMILSTGTLRSSSN